MTSSVRQNIQFKEAFDDHTHSLVVEAVLTFMAGASISQMDILYAGDRNFVVDQAKDEMVRNIMAKLYGPVVGILKEALDEVNTADDWKRNDPYFNAHLAVEDLLLRTLGKVRSL